MSATVRHVRDGYDPTDPKHVYVGRPMRFHKIAEIRNGSRWANPRPLRKGATHQERQALIAWFRDEYVPTQTALLGAIAELRGCTLFCWCKPDDCHGDVWAMLANQDDDTLMMLRGVYDSFKSWGTDQ